MLLLRCNRTCLFGSIPPINILCNSLSNVSSDGAVLAKSSEKKSVKISETHNCDKQSWPQYEADYLDFIQTGQWRPKLSSTAVTFISLCAQKKSHFVHCLIVICPSVSHSSQSSVLRISAHALSSLCLRRINRQSLHRHTYENLSACWKENPGCLCACEHALLAFVPRNWCAHTHHLSVSPRLLNRDSIRKFPCSAFFCAVLPRPPLCVCLSVAFCSVFSRAHKS